MLRVFIFFLSFLFFINKIIAQELRSNDIYVYGSGFKTSDFEATHVSETYTSTNIEESKASNLNNFLANHTSLSLMPAFGDTYSPMIDMRGFGSENGYLAISIFIDGQKINNIDNTGAILGAINIKNIERVEILKGSGSVRYGDGTTAGAILITTKNRDGINISSFFGNYGQSQQSLSLGKQLENFGITINALNDRSNEFSHKDTNGVKDSSELQSQDFKFNFNFDKLNINLGFSNTESNQVYTKTLTRKQFFIDPASNGNKTYVEYDNHNENIFADFNYEINNQYSIKYLITREDKIYDARTYGNIINKKYIDQTFELKNENKNYQTIFGIYDSNKSVTSDTYLNTTDKISQAYYFTNNYFFDDDLTLSFGGRKENIHYSKFSSAEHITEDYNLGSYELGANYRFSNDLSYFVNYSYAFQTPDTDKLVPSYALEFSMPQINLGLKPMKIKTTNIGFNHKKNNNYLKTNLFFSDLKNEIVYNPYSFNNENINNSKKYGVEFFDKYTFSNNLNFSIRYNYIRAVIDNDDQFLSGKNLPGVPRNSILLNFHYLIFNDLDLNLSHTWRQRAYHLADFNNNNKKGVSYESTDINLNYHVSNLDSLKNLNIFLAVSNIFKQKNGTFTYEDSVYPANFQRTWNIGFSADF